MQLIDIVLFFVIFLACYGGLGLIIYIFHKITKNRTHTYHIAIIIFSLLVAATMTYNNLGRSGPKRYPKVLQQVVPTTSPTAQPSLTLPPSVEVSPTP